MKHHKSTRTLGRKSNQRRALLNGLARSLVLHGKIKTTEAKAKEVRPFIEKIITKSRKGTLSARRDILPKIGPKATKKLFEDLSSKYEKRNGGYTRITKLAPRKGDASKLAVIELM